MKDKGVKKYDQHKATKLGLTTTQIRLNVVNTTPPPILNIKR